MRDWLMFPNQVPGVNSRVGKCLMIRGLRLWRSQREDHILGISSKVLAVIRCRDRIRSVN